MLYTYICLLVSRWVVSYVIYLHMSFSESLGGFIEKILAIIHPEWRPSWILRWLTLDTHLKTIP